MLSLTLLGGQGQRSRSMLDVKVKVQGQGPMFEYTFYTMRYAAELRSGDIYDRLAKCYGKSP